MFSQNYNNIKPSFGVRLNYSHPLAQGLAGCWIANEGAGNILFDLSFEENNGNFINSPSWAAGEHGWEVKLDGSDDYIKLPETDFGINGQISVVVWFKINLNNIYRQWLFSHQSAANGAFDLALWDKNSGKPNKVVGQFYKSGAWRQVYGQTVITAGVPHCSIFTYDGSMLKLELDGKPDGNTNYTGSIDPFYFRSTIGANINGNFPTDGNIISVYIYNRALSEHERKHHHFNPYAMFEMPRPIIFGGMQGTTLLDFERGAGRGVTPGVMRGVF